MKATAICFLPIRSTIHVSCLIAGLSLSFQSHAAPLISEILYDGAGSDGASGSMFVELYGSPGESLEGYTLQGINGSNGATYTSISLTGQIPADGIFVVADTASDGTTLVTDADLLINFDFQNGPDSVVLMNGEVVADSVGYGDFSLEDVFAGEGFAAPDAGDGLSLARFFANVDTGDNSVDFTVLEVPTPGLVDLAEVPVPGALWLFGSGLLAMAGYQKRRQSLGR